MMKSLVRTRNVGSAFVLSAALLACGEADQGQGGEEAINVDPKTLEEAADALAQIDALQEINPNDQRALDAMEQLRPRLDELNHLVARIEPRPGHVISFYEVEPGNVGIAEATPQGDDRLLTPNDMKSHSLSDLYLKLSGDESAPASLLEAEQRQLLRAQEESQLEEELVRVPSASSSLESSDPQFGGPLVDESAAHSSLGTTQQALTAADGPWFRDNVCFKGGDSRGCLPNWGGGGWAQFETKTSFFVVAPYSGYSVSVRFRYEGTTKFIDPVYKGQMLSWWWHSSSYFTCGWPWACGTKDYRIRTHRWDIQNASGDGFHWSFAAKWNCTYWSCDTWP